MPFCRRHISVCSAILQYICVLNIFAIRSRIFQTFDVFGPPNFLVREDYQNCINFGHHRACCKVFEEYRPKFFCCSGTWWPTSGQCRRSKWKGECVINRSMAEQAMSSAGPLRATMGPRKPLSPALSQPHSVYVETKMSKEGSEEMWGGCSFTIQVIRRLGSTASSPSGVQGRAPAENGFYAYLRSEISGTPFQYFSLLMGLFQCQMKKLGP